MVDFPTLPFKYPYRRFSFRIIDKYRQTIDAYHPHYQNPEDNVTKPSNLSENLESGANPHTL